MNDDGPVYYFHGAAYGPEDAEGHRKMMEYLRTASKEERFATLVNAGICDERGKLLPPYADEPAG